MTTAARPQWRTSSYSGNGENCVEVAPVLDRVLVRHSKHPEAGTIDFGFPAWAAFVREAVEDQPSANGVVMVSKIAADSLVRSLRTDVELRFDEAEWSAFVAGARDGEFDFSTELAPTVG